MKLKGFSYYIPSTYVLFVFLPLDNLKGVKNNISKVPRKVKICSVFFLNVLITQVEANKVLYILIQYEW